MKVVENHRKGKEKMSKGNIRLFPTEQSFPTYFKTDAHLAAIPNTHSEIEVKKHVVTPLMTYVASHTIHGWFATIDSPLHATLLSGETIISQVNDSVYKSIAVDPEVLFIQTMLNGLAVQFDFVCNNGDNITLNATQIPKEIDRARERMASVYKKYKLKPRIIEDFFHMTILRMKKLPDNNTEQELEDFVSYIDSLHNEIKTHPIMITFDCIWFGHNMQSKIPGTLC